MTALAQTIDWHRPTCGTPVRASYTRQNDGEILVGDVWSGSERVELSGYEIADLAVDIEAERALAL